LCFATRFFTTDCQVFHQSTRNTGIAVPRSKKQSQIDDNYC
jgi:hypothetical protein